MKQNADIGEGRVCTLQRNIDLVLSEPAASTRFAFLLLFRSPLSLSLSLCFLLSVAPIVFFPLSSSSYVSRSFYSLVYAYVRARPCTLHILRKSQRCVYNPVPIPYDVHVVSTSKKSYLLMRRNYPAHNGKTTARHCKISQGMLSGASEEQG